MKILKYAVGTDISKDDFKACISTIDESQKVVVKSSTKFNNTANGFKDFLLWIAKHHKDTSIPISFLMEATGIYYENLAWHLYNQSLNVIVVLPTKAKRYIQSIGIKSKNDKIDAQGLAQMCAEKCFDLWKPLSKNIYILRSLTRMHEDLNIQRTSTKSRLHAIDYAMYDLKQVTKSNEKILKLIEDQIEKLESEIEKLIEKDVLLKSKYEFVNSIKGVGLMTFAVLVAETNGFALINSASQLVSYAGYDVVENQSGNRSGKTRISKKGNAHIRRILNMPAFSVVTHDPHFKKFHERIVKSTGLKMKAYVAVQRKLLCLVYTLWKKNEMYKPNTEVVDLLDN